MRTFAQRKTISGFRFDKYIKRPIPILAAQINEAFQVETLEGIMQGKAGDYLIIGVKGEMYPCDREIFEETYEPA